MCPEAAKVREGLKDKALWPYVIGHCWDERKAGVLGGGRSLTFLSTEIALAQGTPLHTSILISVEAAWDTVQCSSLRPHSTLSILAKAVCAGEK